MKFLTTWPVLLLLAIPMMASADILTGQQVPTPSLLKSGQLNLNVQAQHVNLGNGLFAGAESGVTERVSIAIGQGMQPGEFFCGAHVGVLTTRELQVSVGTLYSTRVRKADLYAVAGTSPRPGAQVFAGAIHREGLDTQAMMGFTQALTKCVTLRGDYITGSGRFVTAAVDYSAAKDLTISPALYISTDGRNSYPNISATYRWK